MSRGNGLIKGITAIVMAGILAGGVCCAGFASRDEDGKWFKNGDLTTWHWKDKTPAHPEEPEEPEEPEDPNNPDDGEKPNDQTSDLDFMNSESKGIMLTSAKMPLTTENGLVSYLITATIIPETATNKAVDWTLEAGEGFVGEVGECLTVTTEQDGALTAEVTCLKAFEGTATLKVTTRDGGFFATCKVIFKGKPQFIKIDTSSLSAPGMDNNWGQTIYEVNTSTTYSLGLSLGNAYDSVDSSIMPNFEIELTGVGEFCLKHYYEGTGGHEDYGIVNCNYTTVYVDGHNEGPTGAFKFWITSNLYTITLENNVLKLQTLHKTVESFSVKNYLNASRTAYEELKFDHYAEANRIPYLEIKITETVTGFSELLNIRIGSAITDVDLSDSEIIF